MLLSHLRAQTTKAPKGQVRCPGPTGAGEGGPSGTVRCPWPQTQQAVAAAIPITLATRVPGPWLDLAGRCSPLDQGELEASFVLCRAYSPLPAHFYPHCDQEGDGGTLQVRKQARKALRLSRSHGRRWPSQCGDVSTAATSMQKHTAASAHAGGERGRKTLAPWLSPRDPRVPKDGCPASGPGSQRQTEGRGQVPVGSSEEGGCGAAAGWCVSLPSTPC